MADPHKPRLIHFDPEQVTIHFSGVRVFPPRPEASIELDQAVTVGEQTVTRLITRTASPLREHRPGPDIIAGLSPTFFYQRVIEAQRAEHRRIEALQRLELLGLNAADVEAAARSSSRDFESYVADVWHLAQETGRPLSTFADLAKATSRLAIQLDMAHGSTRARRAALRPFIERERASWHHNLDAARDYPQSILSTTENAMAGKTAWLDALPKRAFAELRGPWRASGPPMIGHPDAIVAVDPARLSGTTWLRGQLVDYKTATKLDPLFALRRAVRFELPRPRGVSRVSLEVIEATAATSQHAPRDAVRPAAVRSEPRTTPRAPWGPW